MGPPEGLYTLDVEQAPRRILHIDMDAFYASVEQRDDPSLRGQPVAVGGNPARRGVVAAASYEARAFGVRSAMPMARAVRLCPDLKIVAPDFGRYKSVSDQIFALFRAVTPLVEPLSLDEAYLDVTENAWGEALGMEVARRLKRQIQEEAKLTASAGVAPNKFLAKIASGWKKPDGLTVIAPDRIEQFLRELPIEALWGVGPVTARKLHSIGVKRLVDVRTSDSAILGKAVGSQAEWLGLLANGIDDRPVVPDRIRKSCGTENTYATDLVDIGKIQDELAAMARETAEWLRKEGVLARTVTIKVRYGDFSTITRSHTGGTATDDPEDISRRALQLAQRTQAGRVPVRLLGVSVHNLVDSAAGEPAGVSGMLPFPPHGE